jgi:hypothetical protein
MDFITAIMGIADLVCVGLILYAFGINFFTAILLIIMVYKGVMSFVC